MTIRMAGSGPLYKHNTRKNGVMQKYYTHNITKMLSRFGETMSGELNTLQSYNTTTTMTTVRVMFGEMYNPSTDLVLRFVCILGRCSRGGGGARIFIIVQKYTFKHIDGEVWGPNPHPNIGGLGMYNEPKHNGWLKTW